MKRGIVGLLALLILVSSTLVCASSVAPDLDVTLLSQSPDPVEPGQVVKVKFKIENNGGETTSNSYVKIVPQFPFTIYGDEEEKDIGHLRASSTGADAVIVEFNLKVDEAAIEGDTELELMVKTGEDSWIVYNDDDFLIDIQTHDAVLDITSITFEPQQVAPGETAEASIMVKNMADSLLKDIKFKLDFSGDDIPLAPYQSSSERRIALLESDYQNSLVFKFMADPEAVPGLYKVPLTITYNDEKGNVYSVDDILAVVIGEIPKLTAYVKKSTVLQSGLDGELTLEIANTGSSDMKFLELFLLPSADYELITTSDYFYIGDVDSDDTESEVLNIYVNKNVDVLHVPIKLKYADANNKPYQQTFELELDLYSSSQLKKFGVLEKSNFWMYLILVLLGGAGYWYYKKRFVKINNKK